MVLMRFEHMYQRHEDQGLSQPVTLSLKVVLCAFGSETRNDSTSGSLRYL